MADRSKIIFGNQMSAKDYKKALEKKKSYLRGIFRQAGRKRYPA